MSTQITYVTYSKESGCQYYNSNGDEFNGDLYCPPDGRTFVFEPKKGQSGWELDDITFNRISGPIVPFNKHPPKPTKITVDDPGNGPLPESWYDYTLKIKIEDDTIVSDPKIKNTGGGVTLDRK